MNQELSTKNQEPRTSPFLSKKKSLNRTQRLIRLLFSTIDPRAYIHLFRIINYYNHTHVTPRRKLKLGTGVSLSPTVSFANPERIEIGDRVGIGAYCTLWAGPSTGKIIIGDDCLLGPNILITAANYRFNDGSPVTKQSMDEADVVIGRDVWLGANVTVLPGVEIGDGAIVGAGSIVTKFISPMDIAIGSPAKKIGKRNST
jgi:acetyltransferase-like isoleucine patch superfamily enzyme